MSGMSDYFGGGGGGGGEGGLKIQRVIGIGCKMI